MESWLNSILKANSRTDSEFLLLSEQVIVFIALVQGHQHVLQPVPHAQGKLIQLVVHAGGDD